MALQRGSSSISLDICAWDLGAPLRNVLQTHGLRRHNQVPPPNLLDNTKRLQSDSAATSLST